MLPCMLADISLSTLVLYSLVLAIVKHFNTLLLCLHVTIALPLLDSTSPSTTGLYLHRRLAHAPA